MAEPVQTTLILGAGASCAYGFPTGKGLREQILDLSEDDEEITQALMCGKHDVRVFKQAFSESQMYSIDAFLARRPAEFEQIGKRAIAHELLLCERNSKLFHPMDDNWYQYLVNLIVQVEWRDLDLSWLSVVTFNYDRSFETNLLIALQANYRQSVEETIAKLQEIKIVHVYGSLGSPWKTDASDYMVFGERDRWEDPQAARYRQDIAFGAYVRLAAGRLKVIREGDNNDPAFAEARQLIHDAKRVCFLGFGFDKTNMLRLGFPIQHEGRLLVGTAMGVEEARLMRIKQAIFSDNAAAILLAPRMCLQLLDETLVLEP